MMIGYKLLDVKFAQITIKPCLKTGLVAGEWSARSPYSIPLDFFVLSLKMQFMKIGHLLFLSHIDELQERKSHEIYTNIFRAFIAVKVTHFGHLLNENFN